MRYDLRRANSILRAYATAVRGFRIAGFAGLGVVGAGVVFAAVVRPSWLATQDGIGLLLILLLIGIVMLVMRRLRAPDVATVLEMDDDRLRVEFQRHPAGVVEWADPHLSMRLGMQSDRGGPVRYAMASPAWPTLVLLPKEAYDRVAELARRKGLVAKEETGPKELAVLVIAAGGRLPEAVPA
jgi:hypothetical protein